MSAQIREFYDILAKVLIRSWLVGVVLLVVSSVAVYFADGLLDGIHGSWFGLNPHELDLMIYGYLGMLKICINTFFLAPWIAIRWVLGRAKA